METLNTRVTIYFLNKYNFLFEKKAKYWILNLKMDNLEISEEVKKILNEEPLLREEFDIVKNSLEVISDNFSKKDFELNYEKYLEFLDFLSEIATLPKNKNSTW